MPGTTGARMKNPRTSNAPRDRAVTVPKHRRDERFKPFSSAPYRHIFGVPPGSCCPEQRRVESGEDGLKSSRNETLFGDGRRVRRARSLRRGEPPPDRGTPESTRSPSAEQALRLFGSVGPPKVGLKTGGGTRHQNVDVVFRPSHTTSPLGGGEVSCENSSREKCQIPC